MTITDVSPRYQYTIGAQLKGFQNETGVHPTGTHHPYDPDIRGILHSAHTCQIRSRVSTPVARKCDDSWIEFICHK